MSSAPSSSPSPSSSESILDHIHRIAEQLGLDVPLPSNLIDPRPLRQRLGLHTLRSRAQRLHHEPLPLLPATYTLLRPLRDSTLQLALWKAAGTNIRAWGSVAHNLLGVEADYEVAQGNLSLLARWSSLGYKYPYLYAKAALGKGLVLFGCTHMDYQTIWNDAKKEGLEYELMKDEVFAGIRLERRRSDIGVRFSPFLVGKELQTWAIAALSPLVNGLVNLNFDAARRSMSNAEFGLFLKNARVVFTDIGKVPVSEVGFKYDLVHKNLTLSLFKYVWDIPNSIRKPTGLIGGVQFAIETEFNMPTLQFNEFGVAAFASFSKSTAIRPYMNSSKAGLSVLGFHKFDDQPVAPSVSLEYSFEEKSPSVKFGISLGSFVPEE